VRMLFEHGAFIAEDTEATAHVLMWLALGLPAHVLIKALSPAFFAREDTATPLFATLTGTAVTIILALALGRSWGVDGIAASIALGAWTSAFLLIHRSLASFGFSIDGKARRRLPRITVAALTMGGLLWLAAQFQLPSGIAAHGLAQIAVLASLIMGGIAVYGLLLAVFGVINWSDMINAVRHGSRPA
jgi:putative peptidoglycan lipid II flippase